MAFAPSDAYQQGYAPMQGVQSSSSSSAPPASTSSSTMAPSLSNGPSLRGPDYVVFERLPQQAFSRSSLEKATAAKLKLEHYYKKAVDDVVERNARWVWPRSKTAEGAALKGFKADYMLLSTTTHLRPCPVATFTRLAWIRLSSDAMSWKSGLCKTHPSPTTKR